MPEQHATQDRRAVVARGVTVRGTHEPFVEGLDVQAPSGAVTLVAVDPGDAQVAAALVLGGRIEPATGTVTIGGRAGRDVLQSRTRLVDVPDVTAPEEALAVAHVVAEELALAEQPSSRRDVARFLAEHDLTDRSRGRWDSLPAGTRTSLLLELGSRHPNGGVLVLTGPDRHGGDPDPWWRTASALAGRGLTVVVLCTPATAAQLAPRLVAPGAHVPPAGSSTTDHELQGVPA
ncbi:hypothetical protein DFJ68_0830 [Terracoccus luteus]|uniref:ABC transporter family protein n=1 Tax=Terracoccus luteus TaxID=53356 RepID=A0A495XV68_9MICO|nr:hypothetical protein [Terracoccus luteus]RKT77409.1 hypothetical protein DFJ68_0830 [Terracoccus luteus]